MDMSKAVWGLMILLGASSVSAGSPVVDGKPDSGLLTQCRSIANRVPAMQSKALLGALERYESAYEFASTADEKLSAGAELMLTCANAMPSGQAPIPQEQVQATVQADLDAVIRRAQQEQAQLEQAAQQAARDRELAAQAAEQERVRQAAEAARVAAEAQQREVARQAEARRLAELAQAQRLAAEQEAARVEAARVAQEEADRKAAAQAAAEAERVRLAEEQQRAEVERLEREQAAAEQRRVAEEQRIAAEQEQMAREREEALKAQELVPVATRVVVPEPTMKSVSAGEWGSRSMIRVLGTPPAAHKKRPSEESR